MKKKWCLHIWQGRTKENSVYKPFSGEQLYIHTQIQQKVKNQDLRKSEFEISQNKESIRCLWFKHSTFGPTFNEDHFEKPHIFMTQWVISVKQACVKLMNYI